MEFLSEQLSLSGGVDHQIQVTMKANGATPGIATVSTATTANKSILSALAMPWVLKTAQPRQRRQQRGDIVQEDVLALSGATYPQDLDRHHFHAPMPMELLDSAIPIMGALATVIPTATAITKAIAITTSLRHSIGVDMDTTYQVASKVVMSTIPKVNT